MRAVVWLLLLAIVAVVAASLLGHNDNLVTLYWAPWRLDLSFDLFLVALAVLVLVLHALIGTLGSLAGLPRRARAWRVSRRDRIAQAALRDALAQYFGGRYRRAQKAAQRAVDIQAATPELKQDHEFTVLGHLLAASSLHRLQDRAGRDGQLRLALELARRGAIARPAEEGARLLAAEWALDDRDAARTLALLAELPPGVGRRTQALRLKLQASRLAGEPGEALRTARLLAKHQGFSALAAQGLTRTLAMEALDAARDAEQLRRTWREFDAADRRDAFVVAHVARRFVALGSAEEGRAVLRPLWERYAALGDDEREALALALAAATEGIGADWLPPVEAALAARPRDAALAFAAGETLVARQLWGKARSVLEQAVADEQLAPTARRAAWLRLAAMAEQDEDTPRAVRCYRAAASVD